MRTAQTTRCAPLLLYFGPASEFCKRIVGDGRSSADGPRPQDTLAVGLSIHAYRTALSSAEACIAGFADVCAPLNRSIYETQLRLFDISKHGAMAAIACMLYEAEQEVAARQYEQENFASLADSREHLKAWVAWADTLRRRAKEIGISSNDLKAHGQLKFGATANAAGLAPAHKTLYVRHSLASHGTSGATRYLNVASAGLVKEEGGLLLPLDIEITRMLGDALTQLYYCLGHAAGIIGDTGLVDEVVHGYRHLQEEWERLAFIAPTT